MATVQELETALVNADKAGDVDAARKLAAAVTRARASAPPPSPSDLIPVTGDPAQDAAMRQQVSAEGQALRDARENRTMGQRVEGVIETGLATASGVTGGALGMVGGTLKGLAEQILSGQFGTKEAADLVEQSAAQGAQALTYAPRTQAGQEYTEKVGSAMQELIPSAPMTAEMAGLSRAVAPVRRAATDTVQSVRASVAPAVSRAADSVRSATGRAAQAIGIEGASQGGLDSVGAAATPAALQRVATAESLPVPFEGRAALTRGQASREHGQIQFEKEQAKGPNGAPLRERASNQAEVLDQNFDALVDIANPQVIERPAIGSAIDRAVVNKANTAMRRISAAYRRADEAGELEAPVDTTPIVDQIMAVERFEGVAPNARAIRNEGVRLGIMEADADGALQGARISLRDSELFRQFVNDATDWGSPRERMVARRVIESIDGVTENSGGRLYAAARRLRRQYAQEFENSSLTRKLLGTKRGTDERQVAVADIYDRIVTGASLEEMNKLRSTLISAGPEGKQAWANVKAKAIAEIKERATSKSQSDEQGRPLVSPDRLNREIAALDRDGKLESMFGRRQAQVIRDLGEIANVINTAPPGSVNHSNTASALMVALDSAGTFAFTGIPAPVVTVIRESLKHVKNRKVRARIQDALNRTERQ